jgi:hypothetical protein
MADPENDPYVQARRELARRVTSPNPTALVNEQRRVIELMRRRARRSSSLASLYSRMQELERENERLRHGPHGPHGGAAEGYLSASGRGK